MHRLEARGRGVLGHAGEPEVADLGVEGWIEDGRVEGEGCGRAGCHCGEGTDVQTAVMEQQGAAEEVLVEHCLEESRHRLVDYLARLRECDPFYESLQNGFVSESLR